LYSLPEFPEIDSGQGGVGERRTVLADDVGLIRWVLMSGIDWSLVIMLREVREVDALCCACPICRDDTVALAGQAVDIVDLASGMRAAGVP
jgi:hypothetical protein